MTETIVALLIAIRAVESCNGLDVKARGNEYQITRRCVEDVNRVYRTRYRWPRDVRDRETAENIALLYLTYYGMLWERSTGRVPTSDELARIWNRGYEGAKRGEGVRYARKVRKARKARREAK